MLGEKYMRLFVSLLLACLLPVTGYAATAKYQTLRFSQGQESLQVIMDLSGPVKYKYFTLQQPNRFVVDLIETFRIGSHPTLNFAKTPIKNIRVGIRGGNNMRLVFDLAESVTGEASVITTVDGKSHLVVTFKGQQTASPPVRQARVGSRTAPAAARSTADPPANASHRPPPRQEVIREVIVDDDARDVIIAIDAGHGGIDPGARGSKGLLEKDAVLAIARRLEALVKREPGMRPVMIRDGDYFISLRKRVNKARASQSDLFISIHADAFDNPRVSGSSVYALSQRGATTEAARLLANRENAADLLGGVSLEDKDDMLASVLLDLSQNATIEASVDVASRVLQGLKRLGKVHKSRVEQAGFAVLKSPDIPSILVETAFISNPQEERRLRTAKHQQSMAEAMMAGVRSYFKANPPPGTRIAAREHVIERGDTLSGIAERYNISLTALRSANNISGDRIRIGQVLHIPVAGG